MKAEPSSRLINLLNKLSEVNNTDLEKLLSSFRSTKFSIPPFQQIRDVTTSVIGSSDDSEDISDFVIGVCIFFINSAHDIDTVTELFISSISSSDIKGNEKSNLETFIKELFSISNLLLSVKSSVLLSESERVIVSTRLISDVRPVFRSSTSSNIDAFVLTHQLKLVYQDSKGEMNEGFFTLGSEELEELNKCLERESKKAESIRELFNTKQLTIFK